MYKKRRTIVFFLQIVLLIFVIILLKFSGGETQRYFVSNDGNDSNTGKTPKEAWRTIEKVNKYKFIPGDEICFRSGDVWRGQLIPQSGNNYKYISYTSYGIGDKPQILGSYSKNNESDWIQVDNNIWQTSASEVDTGNIIFDAGKEIGIKVWSSDELDEINKFYYDLEEKILKLYCNKNPAAVYSSIECAIRKDIIRQADKSWIIYDGLSLKYGASHGIAGKNTSNIIVRNCEISYIGGGDFYQDGRQNRYGNGIEFWANAKDNLVEDCMIWEVYDAALTNQNNTPDVIQENITYRNNKIWNCEYSFEYWNRPEGTITKNILFKDNECRNAGMGWGHSQRPNPSGRQLCLAANTSSIKDFVIKGNIFYGAEEALIYLHKNCNGAENIYFDNNSYYQSEDKHFALWKLSKYSINDYDQFIQDIGTHKGSEVVKLMLNN